MAHGMGKDDKALAVREPMWHHLEELLSEAPTRQQAEELVHDYSVYRRPLYDRLVDVDGSERFELVPDLELNVRSDTGRRFGVVNKDRVDVDPSQVWDLVEMAQKTRGFGNLQVETAGTYHEGASMYVLLRLDEPIIIKGDHNGESIAFIAFQNGYTMGQALRMQGTNVRIQCWNTSQLADFKADASGLNLSLAHTKNIMERMLEVEEKLQEWRDGISIWKDAKEELASMKVTTAQTQWFIEQFMWMPEFVSDRVRNNVEMARLELIGEYFSDMMTGVRGTALGLFEAASSYEGYVRDAQSRMTRFRRSMLSPDSTLRQAADLAREAATV